MRLFLTSNGFPEGSEKLKKEFLNFIDKDIDEIKLAFIPTASIPEEDKWFVTTSKELERLGILKKNIIDFQLDKPVSFDDLKEFDVIFVDGGNTFYLLEKVMESGFDEAIKEYLEKDIGVYVGVSAGTILVGPDVEIAEPWDDKSITNLKDTKGLNLIDIAYSPHWVEEDEKMLEPYRKKANYEIKKLRDGEVVIVFDDEIKFI